MESEILIERLRALIGTRFRYLDIDWRIVEVLGEEDALVLMRCDNSNHPVQHSQYGQPQRRVPQTLTLPLSDGEGQAYSDEVLELLSGRLAGD